MSSRERASDELPLMASCLRLGRAFPPVPLAAPPRFAPRPGSRLRSGGWSTCLRCARWGRRSMAGGLRRGGHRRGRRRQQHTPCRSTLPCPYHTLPHIGRQRLFVALFLLQVDQPFTRAALRTRCHFGRSRDAPRRRKPPSDPLGAVCGWSGAWGSHAISSRRICVGWQPGR